MIRAVVIRAVVIRAVIFIWEVVVVGAAVVFG